MPLFQKSVIKQAIDNYTFPVNINSLFEKYKQTYAKHEHISAIRKLREVDYYESFLRDFFVEFLGYTKSESSNANLFIQQKNVGNTQRADAAITKGGRDGKVLAVIELKSTATKNLDTIEEQAFGYRDYQPGCKYVITSNFEKLRLYIDYASEYIEFNLFELTISEFKKLYYLLCHKSIFDDVPDKLKKKSLVHEEEISKILYKDYSDFKHKIFQNLIKNHPDRDKLTLLKNTHKLLDRFLFIFFAEDKNLLPENTISKAIKNYQIAVQLSPGISLYDAYKKYFEFIDKGNDDDNYKTIGYNGELFKHDEELDGLKIDDEILIEDTVNLSKYDFDSEVDVNILGHIFEHSLNEMEAMQAEIKGEEFKAQAGKRKKDGVYYTPNYITKYIVENTIGKLCYEKKQELNLSELNLDHLHVNRKRKKMSKEEQDLHNRLMQYHDFLVSLKICDPACGSGAFLNQALDYLIAEHSFIDKNRRILEMDAMGLYDIEQSILENNLYGVDINEEAVEIAKLSLWLRTARKGRKLSRLSTKIKCGNSLIDDPEVAGDKAFKWEEEFPEVFANGGFDVVIGNPPYVRGRDLDKNEREFLKIYNLESTDTAIIFMKRSMTLLSKNGVNGFIVPKSLLFASNWDCIRAYILPYLERIIDCGKVWHDVLLEQIIYIANTHISTKYYTGLRNNDAIKELDIIDKKWAGVFDFLPARVDNCSIEIAFKMKSRSKSLNECAENLAGIPYQKYISENGDYKMIGGAEFDRYGIHSIKGMIGKEWTCYDNAFIRKDSLIVQNIIAHILNPKEHIKIIACIPEEHYINNTVLTNTVNQLIVEHNYSNKYLWCILNSEVLNWYVYNFMALCYL